MVLFALEIKVQVLIFVIKWNKPFFIIKEISSLFLKNQFLLSLELCLKGFFKFVFLYFCILMRFQRLRFTFTLLYILVGHDCGERWKCLECFCDYVLIDSCPYIFSLKYKTTWDLRPYHHNKCVSYLLKRQLNHVLWLLNLTFLLLNLEFFWCVFGCCCFVYVKNLISALHWLFMNLLCGKT